jgi:hypothetical protein
MTGAVRIGLGAALATIVVGVAVALAHAPMSVARVNRAASSAEAAIAHATAGADYCQAQEALPAHTSLIRVSLQASIGPRVALSVSSNGRTIASGVQGSAWTGAVVSVPVRPLADAVSDVTVCVSFHAHDELLTLYGKPVPGLPATSDGEGRLPGSMRIEYLRAGARSWASMLSSIVSRMGLGRAFEGDAIASLVFALLAAIAILTSTLVARELR